MSEDRLAEIEERYRVRGLTLEGTSDEHMVWLIAELKRLQAALKVAQPSSLERTIKHHARHDQR